MTSSILSISMQPMKKVLYEKTVRSLKDRQYDSQLVNPPVILTLNQGEALLLEQYLEYFKGDRF